MNPQKTRTFRCPDCASKYTNLNLLMSHVEREHEDVVPDEWSVKRYLFNRRNKKTTAYCVICKTNETAWNEELGRYERYCSDACRARGAQIAKENMVKVYGKEHLLNDPDKQREMLQNRSISGLYTFSDGKTKLHYTGSYELDFLTHCDRVLKIPAKEVQECPHVFSYKYDGKKSFYIPDFYLESYRLIVEIKDGGDNPNMHHKIQAVDKVKEQLKDQAIIKSKAFNYIKVINKDYTRFNELIKLLKENFINNDQELYIVM